MAKRKYTLKRRAQRQEATRKRIVEAAVTLHERLGPLATTVSAIAEEAGVQRLTVYRHFPDETRLFEACTSSWLKRNPPPDPSEGSDVEDPVRRTRAVLEKLYAYYRRTQGMWSPVFRDLDSVPALQEPMAGFFAYLDGIREALSGAWEAAGSPGDGVRAAILGHALRFSTWASLAEEGLSDPAMAGLVLEWLAAISRTDDPGSFGRPATGQGRPGHSPV